MTLLAFIEKQHERDDTNTKKQRERDEIVRREAKADRAEMEAKMERQRKEMELQQAALKAELTLQLTVPPPAPATTDERLAALQARVEGLHATKLLTDEELFALEDLVADYVELTASVTDGVITKDMIYAMPTAGVASKLDKLVGLSAAMAGDAAFARQARRKFL
jgi:hypothetical protein